MTEAQALGARPGANAGQSAALEAAEQTSAVESRTIGPNAIRYIYREEAAFALEAPEGSPVVKANFDYQAEGILIAASRTVLLEHGIGKVPDILEVSQMPDTAPLTISADADAEYITVTNHNPDSEATAHIRAVSIPEEGSVDEDGNAVAQEGAGAPQVRTGKTLDQLAVEEAQGYSPPEGPGADAPQEEAQNQAANANEQDPPGTPAQGMAQGATSPDDEAPSRKRRRQEAAEQSQENS